MKCPFLKEERVCSCTLAPVRKQIPCAMIHEADEKCVSSAYERCDIARGHASFRAGLDRCPFLQESLAQYCEAAAVRRFIPLNGDAFSRCNRDAHRYCDTYLQRVHPCRPPAPTGDGPPSPGGDEIPVPERLAFSRNHMWLDVAADGSFHVGVDAFLARVLGCIERGSFVFERGLHHPTVVLTVQQVDLPLAFPQPLQVTACNTLLRRHPEALTEDPYGRGWLFEGYGPEEGRESPGPTLDGLLEGAEAVAWMRREVERMTGFVHDLLARRSSSGEVLVADGGVFGPGLAAHLQRRDLLRLYGLFFAPYVE